MAGEVITVPALPPPPAAVEVAAYRIVVEAMANATRYADADHLFIRLTVVDDADLSIDVRDNGTCLEAISRDSNLSGVLRFWAHTDHMDGPASGSHRPARAPHCLACAGASAGASVKADDQLVGSATGAVEQGG